MTRFGQGALLAAALLFAGGALAGELQNVTVESVDEEANTATIQGVTYQLGEEASPTGLQPGEAVHIWFEDEDGEPVLTKYEPASE